MIELELRRAMPKTGRTRLYAMVEMGKDLFGVHVLRVRFGRVGWSQLRERDEAFENEVALVARVRRLVTRRLQHGYAAHFGDVTPYDGRKLVEP